MRSPYWRVPTLPGTAGKLRAEARTTYERADVFASRDDERFALCGGSCYAHGWWNDATCPGGTNVLYLDGHVDYLRYEEYGTPPATRGIATLIGLVATLIP